MRAFSTDMEIYRVEWIEEVTAVSHEHAASIAYAMLFDPKNAATGFFVQGPRDAGKFRTVEIERT